MSFRDIKSFLPSVQFGLGCRSISDIKTEEGVSLGTRFVSFRDGILPGFSINGLLTANNGHALEEGLLHERLDDPGETGTGGGTFTCGSLSATSVQPDAFPFMFRFHPVGFHAVPAAGATKNAGEQAVSVVDAGALLGALSELPCAGIDQGYVRVGFGVFPGAGFPEVDPVGEYMGEAAGGPVDGPVWGFDAFHESGEFTPACPVGFGPEDFGDAVGVGAGMEPAGLVSHISGGCAAGDMDAATDSVFAGDSPGFAAAFPFEFRDGEHHVESESAHRGGRVEAVFCGEERTTCFVDAFEGVGGVGYGTAEPVELGDHDPVDGPGFDHVEGPLESGPVGFGPGLVEVFDPFRDMVASCGGNTGTTLALNTGRDKRFPGSSSHPADAQVCDQIHTGRYGTTFLASDLSARTSVFRLERTNQSTTRGLMPRMGAA